MNSAAHYRLFMQDNFFELDQTLKNNGILIERTQNMHALHKQFFRRFHFLIYIVRQVSAVCCLATGINPCLWCVQPPKKMAEKFGTVGWKFSPPDPDRFHRVSWSY